MIKNTDDQVPSLTLCDTFRPNSRHVSMGRQVPRGRLGPRSRQVPSLTLCGMLRPDGRHVSMGHQGPSGRQVPSLTPLDMLCLNGR